MADSGACAARRAVAVRPKRPCSIAPRPQIAACKEPWNRLQIDYTVLGAESREWSPFTIENDRYLICMTLQVSPIPAANIANLG